MVNRRFWLDRIERAWREKSVVWLPGVRRSGKTVLCQSLPRAEYFDCERPRHRRMMEDPEAFLESLAGKRVVLDEIHRLSNPSELLKIAADHYPSVKVLATGSSTFGATAKFRDTLTGRKREIRLTPMCHADLVDFRHPSIEHRIVHGGLPPFFLAKEVSDRDFDEWMQAYWARDIQELFRVGRRASFMKFVELLMTRSGTMFEATAFAGPCEISRPTVASYLSVLEETFVVSVVRPFTSRRATEIVSAPRVYIFDTGFACHYRQWSDLRPDDFGGMWEHIVLNELNALEFGRRVHYWRTKDGHEMDFVLALPGKHPLAIECKRTASSFDPANLLSFAKTYPRAGFMVIAHDVSEPFTRRYEGRVVSFLGLANMSDHIARTVGS